MLLSYYIARNIYCQEKSGHNHFLFLKNRRLPIAIRMHTAITAGYPHLHSSSGAVALRNQCDSPFVMEHMGLEPTTSTLPVWRAPNCANAPKN